MELHILFRTQSQEGGYFSSIIFERERISAKFLSRMPIGLNIIIIIVIIISHRLVARWGQLRLLFNIHMQPVSIVFSFYGQWYLHPPV